MKDLNEIDLDYSSTKDIYYKEIQNGTEINENLIVFRYLQNNPDKVINCHDVAKILNKDTNRASRIFDRLKANDLIEFSGHFINKYTNRSINHYKYKEGAVWNIEKQNIKILNERNEMKKQLRIIMNKLCVNNNKISKRATKKIMNTITEILCEIQDGEDLNYIKVKDYLQGENAEYINADEFLKKYTRIFKSL